MPYYYLPPTECLLEEQVGEVTLVIYEEGIVIYPEYKDLLIWDSDFSVYSDQELFRKYQLHGDTGGGLAIQDDLTPARRPVRRIIGRYYGKGNIKEILRAVRNFSEGRVYAYVALDIRNNLLSEGRCIPADLPQEVMQLARDNLTAYQSR